MRSGAQTLVMLAAPLNAAILHALADGAKRQAELLHLTGAPAQTTLRAQLKKLVNHGVIEKRRRNRFPGVLEYELTRAGRKLLFVVAVLEHWLEGAPGEPQPLGGTKAKTTIKAFAEAWSSAMLRALAARPLSLTELDGLVSSLSYPSLERRLAAMRLAGLVEACRGDGRGTPYMVTDWLRAGVAPFAAAARWERRHRVELTPPIGQVDVEGTFLLALPLTHPTEGLSGSCRLAVELPGGKRRRLAGVTVEVVDGAIASGTTQLEGKPGAWALGPPLAWLAAVIEHDTRQLDLGGDCRLARDLLEGLHEALFGPAHMLRTPPRR